MVMRPLGLISLRWSVTTAIKRDTLLGSEELQEVKIPSTRKPQEEPFNSEVSTDSNCSSSCLENTKILKEQNEQLLKDLRSSKINAITYKIGLESVEARILVYKKNKSIYEEDIKLLKQEFEYEPIVSEPTVKKPVSETSKAKASADKPKVERKNFGLLLIEDWISDSEDEAESKPNIEKTTVKPSFAKIEFVKSKKQVKSHTKTIVKQDKGMIDSGCSRHMIRNMSYLTDYKEIDGGYVSFGGNPKGGKITGRNPNWLFDIDALTKSMNYKPVIAGNQSNGNAGTKACDDAGKDRMETIHGKDYILLPLWTTDLLISQELKSYQDDGFQPSSDDGKKVDEETRQEKMPALEDISTFNFSSDHKDDDEDADMNYMDTTIQTLVDLPYGKRAIGTKWVFQNKKDERDGCQECFFYGKIKENVYVCQPIGFEDPDFPDKVYNVEKALYGLHQASRAWYETLSTYLLDNGFHRGKIDKTLFIRRHKDDILLVQVYVDDIIFSSTKKELCNAFEKMMHGKFQLSSIGELTFFLGLQVKQKKDGIFISQDKYIAEILKKYGFLKVKNVSTPMKTQKPLLKDEDGEEVYVHMYRSMIGSLMYLTSSRPDIMFVVCAYARYQVNPKFLYFHAVKRKFLAYTDSDYDKASLDRKSTTKGCQFLGCRLISWQCKKQTAVANSTTEAEYVAASSPIQYALTVNLTVYTSCIEQFWATVKAKTINGEGQLQALVDGKKVIITGSTIRRDLQLEDAKGVDCLPNVVIFEQLTLIGMVKNLDNVNKFLMYPRNMKRVEKGFFGRDTPLFPTLMVQAQEDMGKGAVNPTDPHHTPTISQPSTSQPQKKQKSRKSMRKDIKLPQTSVPTSVADEAVNEEMDDSLERAATNATSLDAEQDMGGGPRYQEAMGDIVAQTRSERVAKVLGEEDASKQGRITDIDSNEDIYLVNVHKDKDIFGVNDSDGDEVIVEDAEMLFDVADNLRGEEVFVVQQDDKVKKEVDAAQIQVSTAATTPTISIDEATLAQSLTELKHAKPKAKAKGLYFMSQKKPVKLKKKDQIQLDKEVALKLQAELQAKFKKEQRLVAKKAQQELEANIALIESWDDVQAKFDADFEQDELTGAEKAKLFMEFLEKRKKFFAAKRAEEKRNRPPTRAQQRTIIKMLKFFDSEDLEVLWRLVEDRFEKENPVDNMDSFLLHNLKTMFEHHVEDNVSNNDHVACEKKVEEVKSFKVLLVLLHNYCEDTIEFELLYSKQIGSCIKFLLLGRKGTKKAVKKRFGGNAAAKKTQRNLLKQQYENFTASSSEVLDQTFDRLQNLISQLEIHGEIILQEDVNQKAPRSQDTKHKESTRRTVPIETPASSALVSCDGLGGLGYNTVPPPYTEIFLPPKPNLSGLEEFVNESKVSEPIVKKPIVETSEAMASVDKPKVEKKNFGPPLIEDWISNSKEEAESKPKIKKKIVKPSFAKIKEIYSKIHRNMKRVGKIFSGRDTPLFQTMMVQAQEEMGKDEAVNEEMDDSLERAATTATSLDAEHDRGNISKTQSKATPNKSSSYGIDSGGGPRLLDLETTKTTQAMEIESLKRRVKKPEKKERSRTHKLKRLYKVGLSARVEFSKDEGLGEEDASKSGRIADIDSNEDIYLVNVHKDKDIFLGKDSDDDEVIVEDIEMLFDIVDVLRELKHAKPKAKAKRIVFHEPEESTTTITTVIPKLKSQGKGKAKMIKEPVKLKKKDQIQLDNEVALKLQA
nr:putative ribonuclease H-like domain-containing protein [Tanacetum cinerariifolium]